MKTEGWGRSKSWLKSCNNLCYYVHLVDVLECLYFPYVLSAICIFTDFNKSFPGGSIVKNPPTIQETALNAGDMGSILVLGRYPREENGNPLQYCHLGNPMDRGAWWATVHGVVESDMTGCNSNIFLIVFISYGCLLLLKIVVTNFYNWEAYNRNIFSYMFWGPEI